MDALSPQGALLAQCISRLPERSLPRHAWAAELLVEQLWACADEGPEDHLREVLSPLIWTNGVNVRRVRSEVWGLARSGLLVPVGVGAEARFKVAEGHESRYDFLPLRNRAVDFAAGQLTARLLALSNTANAC
ncbi:hypothetical protein HUF15_31685 [Streptomyces samsunensis]|uniref:hypothetical protein n=1 Tax=Streptomyces malaysiensis TaxID=92644 RepID=UPI0015819798|nr:hypothetical protein [Streptomyces samsunensis]NUH41248.1 hypothetical protein [Streptomyces samsunensis]